MPTPARHVPSKASERAMALVFALVVVLTLGGSVVAFVFSANGFIDALKTAMNVVIFGTIILNLTFSIVVWFFGRVRSKAMIGTKAWDLSAGAVLSVMSDVIALLLAILSVTITPGLYLYLAFALLADDTIDVVVHFKR